MKNLNECLEDVGLILPRILLPRDGVELEKFAVIACDQHSAEKKYWEETQRIVGNAPSSLNMMMPEAWLGTPKENTDIFSAMDKYLKDGVLKEIGKGFVYIKRQTTSGVRCGLLAAVDLERYDYNPGSKGLMRPTEQTIKERLPTRVEIRRKAPLEMPHVLLLIDDKKNLLKALCEEHVNEMEKLYSFDLMQGGGHIDGYFPGNEEFYFKACEILKNLLVQSNDGFLYAVGDGNHSLAAAKECWNEIKQGLSAAEIKDHPARYAMVEIVSIYDEGLSFQPIHRLLYNVDAQEVQSQVGFDAKNPPELQILQPKLDKWLEAHPEAELEYIHGAKECEKLGEEENRLSIVFNSFERDSFFENIVKNGVYARKSFSLGEACDKRYYLECRKIK